MSKIKIIIISIIALVVIAGFWFAMYFFVFADKGIDETEVAQAYKNEKTNNKDKKPNLPDEYAVNVITEILSDEKTKDEKIVTIYDNMAYFTKTFGKYINHKDIEPTDYGKLVLFAKDIQAAKNGSASLTRDKVDGFKDFLKVILKVENEDDEDYFKIKETLQQETGFAVDVHSKLGWKIKDFRVNTNYPNNEANPNVGICLVNNSKEDIRVTFSKSRTENKNKKVMETGKGRYGIYDDYVNCLKQVEILNQAKKEGNTGTKKDGSLQKATGIVQNDITMETVTIKPGQYVLVDGVYASSQKK